MMPALTNSEMAAFTNCRRGWWLRYYRQLQRRHEYSSLPSVGNFYHIGLEAYYNMGETNVTQLALNYAEEMIRETPDLSAQIMKDVELAVIMLEGYFEWLEETGSDVGLKIIGAEQAVEVPLEGTQLRLRGKIDTRMEREVDGAWLQLENKTVGNLTDIPKYAQGAPQFLTYDLLAFLKAREEKEGRATDGVILNMARRVKRTASAKPPFYARHEVRHNVHELRAHWKHVVAVGTEIQSVRAKLDAGAEHHDICPPTVSRNHTWSCPCAPITTMFDDGSDVEGFLAETYEEHDPWARYEEVKDGI